MPQGTNSTVCGGQAKHYQLCQQQVRTASSTDRSSLGDAGLRGSRSVLQEEGVTGLSEQCRRIRSWSGSWCAFEGGADGLYCPGLRWGKRM